MTTGNPNPESTPPGNSGEQIRKIPPAWFMGIGRTDHGIHTVHFSPAFYNLATDLREQVDIYEANMGDFLEEPLPMKANQIKDEKKREMVMRAVRRIKEITKFSMEELLAEKERLEKKFQNKKDKVKDEITFDFQLF